MKSLIVHLSAGQGPEECQWVVAQLASVFCREAAAQQLECTPVEPVAGPSASILLRVTGTDAESFVQARTGTIRWIGTSPFRPAHKRRNWFVGFRRVRRDRGNPRVPRGGHPLSGDPRLRPRRPACQQDR